MTSMSQQMPYIEDEKDPMRLTPIQIIWALLQWLAIFLIVISIIYFLIRI